MSGPIEGTPGEGFGVSSNPSQPGSERFGAEEKEGAAQKAAEVLEQSKEKARELGSKAQERMFSKAEELRGGTAQRLRSFADALEELSHGDGREELAPVARYASGFVRRAGDLLDQRSAEELIQRARDEVRDRPGLVLLGMAAVGFLGARLLKE